MKVNYYASPRWSQEITDCSMPMSLDTYSLCSYRCLYCFSFFQRSVGATASRYLNSEVRHVNVERIKKMFTDPKETQFSEYIRQRRPMQWGGLSDQFDEFEREQGVSLELLRFFREIEYPISFSTKGTWWTEDDRYVDIFRGAEHFNLKFSIITLDEEKARKVEVDVPTPKERLRAIERAATWGIGGVTLRLRPVILGISTPSYLDLIRQAADHGADAVSTEFMCLETRGKRSRPRFEHMSKVAGIDLWNFYRKGSPRQTGYLRLAREVKRPYFEAMKEVCDEVGLRFYVSDAHFKELCPNASCCGLRPSWNYSRGQFTQALLYAKRNGTVRWSDIEQGLSYAEQLPYNRALGFNKGTVENEIAFRKFSMKDWIRWNWNNVNGGKSPYKYFGGILYPIGKDESGDIIYEYRDKPVVPDRGSGERENDTG